MIWVIGILCTTLAGAFILRPILRGSKLELDGADKDIAFYKAQLAGLDSDLERGIISPNEAENSRLEISRRILAADKRDKIHESDLNPKAKWIIASISMIAVVAGSLGLYATLGSYELPDQPLAKRIADAQKLRSTRTNQFDAEKLVPLLPINADPDYLELVAQLRLATSQQPNDIKGQRLLALHEARLGNFVAAKKAQENVITLSGENVMGPEFTSLAEFMILATNGYVSPEAEAVLARALRLDARDARARYYSGLSMAQNGRPDVAYRLWQGLLEEGPADAPWIALIQQDIGAVARAAGVLPDDPLLPGPTGDQIDSAQNMSETDRNEMIRGMVDGLANRLATEGGSADEWARLIRALGVLGETKRASTIWLESQQVFADDQNALYQLSEAAKAAEVSQ